MASVTVRNSELHSKSAKAGREQNVAARYAYRAEQTAQVASSFAAEGFVLELVPALAMLNQSD